MLLAKYVVFMLAVFYSYAVGVTTWAAAIKRGTVRVRIWGGLVAVLWGLFYLLNCL